MILDTCVGSEKIYQKWHKNENLTFIGIDIRKGDFSFQNETQYVITEVKVKPTVLADMRFLPFKDKSFDCIVCDPPHLKCGEKSFMNKSYGSWSQTDVIRTLRLANSEFARVLKQNGMLLLKIMRDRINTYKEMLKSFSFFLPIQLKRPRGSFKNPKGDVDGALWMVGFSIQCK